MIYALFYCLANVTGTCVHLEGPFNNLADCNRSKARITRSAEANPNSGIHNGVTFVCMSKPAPPVWSPVK